MDDGAGPLHEAGVLSIAKGRVGVARLAAAHSTTDAAGRIRLLFVRQRSDLERSCWHILCAPKVCRRGRVITDGVGLNTTGQDGEALETCLRQRGLGTIQPRSRVCMSVPANGLNAAGRS